MRSQIISNVKNNDEHSRMCERTGCLKPAEDDPLSAKVQSSRMKVQSHTMHTWDQEGHWDQVHAEKVLAKIKDSPRELHTIIASPISDLTPS